MFTAACEAGIKQGSIFLFPFIYKAAACNRAAALSCVLEAFFMGQFWDWWDETKRHDLPDE